MPYPWVVKVRENLNQYLRLDQTRLKLESDTFPSQRLVWHLTVRNKQRELPGRGTPRKVTHRPLFYQKSTESRLKISSQHKWAISIREEVLKNWSWNTSISWWASLIELQLPCRSTAIVQQKSKPQLNLTVSFGNVSYQDKATRYSPPQNEKHLKHHQNLVV